MAIPLGLGNLVQGIWTLMVVKAGEIDEGATGGVHGPMKLGPHTRTRPAQSALPSLPMCRIPKYWKRVSVARRRKAAPSCAEVAMPEAVGPDNEKPRVC
jgi:hypothetical protein